MSKKLTCIFTVSQATAAQQQSGFLYLDVRPEYRQLRRNLHVLQLPLRQFRFIQALMANHPTPLTHWDLFYHVWGEGTRHRDGTPLTTDEDGGPLVAADCIQQLAAKLRKKLAPLGLTVQAPRKGYGYQLLEKEEENEKTSKEDPRGRSPRGRSRGHGTPRSPEGSTPTPRGSASCPHRHRFRFPASITCCLYSCCSQLRLASPLALCWGCCSELERVFYVPADLAVWLGGDDNLRHHGGEGG